MTVKVKFADFEQVTRRRSYLEMVDRRDGLRAASLDLVRLVLPPEKGVRLVGVTVSNFAAPRPEGAGLPLFGSPPGALGPTTAILTHGA